MKKKRKKTKQENRTIIALRYVPAGGICAAHPSRAASQ